MDSQRLPNVVKWDGWPGSTTRDDTSAPTTYQTKQDQSYVQMNTVNIFKHLFLSGQWLHILYLYSSLSGSVFLSCMSCISINFKKLWKSVERMAQCSVQGSYGWVRWHAASPCLSRWQLWKISPLSAHRHTHTLYCLHKYTHTHNALLHNYAHSTADKVASMIPVRAHCSGYIYVQHAHKHVHNQMCAQCANKHIVVVAGTQHTTHVYRGCLPRPPVYTPTKGQNN